jgi:hypothetical protein
MTFWSDFRRVARTVRAHAKAKHLERAFEPLDALFTKHGLDFPFELSIDEAGLVLAFSPMGDEAIARRIDALLEQRPRLAGWRFLGRLPRKDVDDALALVRNEHDVDLEKARFRVSRVGDRFAIKATGDGEAVTTFLFHALGEEQAMAKLASLESVKSLRGRALGPRELVEVILAEA